MTASRGVYLLSLSVGLLSSTVLLAACAGPAGTGTMAQRVVAWSSGVYFGGSGGQAATLIADNNRISYITSHGNDPAAFRTDCLVLENDSAQFNGTDLPSPDTTLTNLLSQAFDDDGKAAQDCYLGAGKDPAKMALSSKLRIAALANIQAAQARILVLTAKTAVATDPPVTSAPTTTGNPPAGSTPGS